jgi:hypothetical protein
MAPPSSSINLEPTYQPSQEEDIRAAQREAAQALQALQAQAALCSSDEEQRELAQPCSTHSGSTLYASPGRGTGGGALRAAEQLWSRSFSTNGFSCKVSALVQSSSQPGCEPSSRLLVALECCAAVGDALLAVPSAKLGLGLEVTTSDGSYMSWGEEEGAEEVAGAGSARTVEQPVCCVAGEDEVAAQGAGAELAQLVQQGGELRLEVAVTVS